MIPLLTEATTPVKRNPIHKKAATLLVQVAARFRAATELEDKVRLSTAATLINSVISLDNQADQTKVLTQARSLLDG